MAEHTLSALPAELLLEICRFLDDESLYELGRTCKHTHFPAFSTFLRRHDIDDPGTSTFLYLYNLAPLGLVVLNAVLCFKSVESVTLVISPGYDRLRDDVANLRRFVASLVNNRSFHLDFSAAEEMVNASQVKLLDKERWAMQLTGLFDLVIRKGCQSLEVSGGAPLRRLYSHSELPGLPSVYPRAGILEELLSKDSSSSLAPTTRDTMQDGYMIQDIQPVLSLGIIDHIHESPNQIGRPHHTPSTTPPTVLPDPSDNRSQPVAGTKKAQLSSQPHSRLRTVWINSSMLLQYTFYPWTVGMLSKGSSTITQLHLHCCETPTAHWSEFLWSTTLPSLQTLDISTDYGDSSLLDNKPKFDDLLAFFERHPTIETLDLRGVERPEPRPVLKLPILPLVPALRHVTAPPIWVSSLVKLLDTHADALPDLYRIGIATGYVINNDIDCVTIYDLVDDALRCIPSLPRKIELRLKFQADGMLKWFDDHVALGKGTGVISSLTRVCSLAISTPYGYRIRKEDTSHFEAWINLFPSLQTLDLLYLSEWAEEYSLAKDTAFWRRLAVAQPTLDNVRTIEGPIRLLTLWDGADRVS